MNPNYLPVMPYLIVQNARSFSKFAQYVFGATEQQIMPLEDTPLIMHGELRIGDAVIMFADATQGFAEKTAGMFLYVDKVDEVLSRALSRDGTLLMPAEQKNYGYTAGFEDPFGNHWWIVEG